MMYIGVYIILCIYIYIYTFELSLPSLIIWQMGSFTERDVNMSSLAPHFDIGERWRVQVKPRLPLPPAVLVERLQRQAVDSQPLAGAELSAELQGVALGQAQLVGHEDVQPGSVHVEGACGGSARERLTPAAF